MKRVTEGYVPMSGEWISRSRRFLRGAPWLWRNRQPLNATTRGTLHTRAALAGDERIVTLTIA
jgi:hypothetical protein